MQDVTNDSIEHPMLPKDVTKVGSVTDPSVVTKAPNKFKQNFRALRRSLVSGQESLERMDKKFKNANINAKTQGVRTATTQGENILTKGLSDMNGKNIGESFVPVIKKIPKHRVFARAGAFWQRRGRPPESAANR